MALVVVAFPAGVTCTLALGPADKDFFGKLGSVGDFAAGWAACWTVAFIVAQGPETFRVLAARRTLDRLHDISMEVREALEQCRSAVSFFAHGPFEMSHRPGYKSHYAVPEDVRHARADEAVNLLIGWIKRLRAASDQESVDAIDTVVQAFVRLEISWGGLRMAMSKHMDAEDEAPATRARLLEKMEVASATLREAIADLAPTFDSAMQVISEMPERGAQRAMHGQ